MEDSDLQEPVVQFQRQAETEEREEAACTPAVLPGQTKGGRVQGRGLGAWTLEEGAFLQGNLSR